MQVTIFLPLLVALSFTEVTAAPLPCDSQLRLVLPHLFSHCSECTYTDWSEWEKVQYSVSTSECPSGKAFIERRTRTISSGEACIESLSETKAAVCVPDQADRFILALNLGGTGQDFTSLQQPDVYYYRITLCPATGQNGYGYICQGFTVPHGKRSLTVSEKPNTPNLQDAGTPAQYNQVQGTDKPLPFVWSEHSSRFRRNVDTCNTHYILFVLDTSGSIGSSDFGRMTSAISQLMALFCKPVQAAVMTFNVAYHLEFCFNCFDNTLAGRNSAMQAISNIQYRGGYTHTAGAAQCVCNELLNTGCGLEPGANCIDVVFVTDGRSNDPSRQICDEIRCIHDHSTLDINTYAIGIDNYNPRELNCIAESSSDFSIFEFESFDEFEEEIQEVVRRLAQPALTGGTYTCVNPNSPA